MIYFPASEMKVRIDLRRLRSGKLRAWGYDPGTGIGSMVAGSVAGHSGQEWKSPSYGLDWVLVLDDVAAGFAGPGLEKWWN
jgi:hypothetical protein